MPTSPDVEMDEGKKVKNVKKKEDMRRRKCNVREKLRFYEFEKKNIRKV